MLRINWDDSNGNGIVMKLEGQVIGLWVSEVRTCCEHFLSQGRSLRLDMAEVSFLDEDGVALIQQLMTRKVQVDGCTPFLVELLKSEPSSA